VTKLGTFKCNVGAELLTANAASFLLLPPTPANARGKLQSTGPSILVLKNSGTMRFQKDSLVTNVLGVVGEEGIPRRIGLGDIIKVEDWTFTKCLANLEWGGTVLCETGQVKCVVVERPEDVPSDRDTHRFWITVDHCRPLNRLRARPEVDTMATLHSYIDSRNGYYANNRMDNGDPCDRNRSFDALLEGGRECLAPFCVDRNKVAFALPAHVVTAREP